MKKQLLLLSTFLTITLSGAQCTLSTPITKASTLNAESLGQVFVPTCDGVFTSLTFDSRNDISGGATFELREVISTDDLCGGPLLYTETLSALVIGDNTVTPSSVISLDSAKTYYFKTTTTNDGDVWEANFRNTTALSDGYLVSHQGGTAGKNGCDWVFSTRFDLTFSLVIDAPLSVSEVSANQTKIYPNPVKDIFTITNSQSADIIVYNILGKVVLNKKMENNNDSVDISNLNTGVYYVSINNNGVISNKKIVKN
ncbi:MAG: T9SS type A sorting domain-containing protein [Algibacter sp.]